MIISKDETVIGEELATLQSDKPRIIKFRTQNDGKNEQVSDQTGTDCSDDPGLTRQEFAADADINNIMKKFEATGQLPPNTRPGQSTAHIDYDIGLQEALMAAQNAKELYATMPEELLRRYPTFQGFIRALDSGEIKIYPKETPQPEGNTNEGTDRNTSLRDDPRPQGAEREGGRPEDRGAREADSRSEGQGSPSGRR